MKKYELIAEKQAELIEILDRYFVSRTRPSLDELGDSENLKYEIKELESQEVEGVTINEPYEHRKRLNVLEKHLGDDFYETGQYHISISDAMREYANYSKVTDSMIEKELLTYTEYLEDNGMKDTVEAVKESIQSKSVVKDCQSKEIEDWLTKQGYTKTVTYPDKRTVEPCFQRSTVVSLLEQYHNSKKREELIKFLFHILKCGVSDIDLIEGLQSNADIVDEYLSKHNSLI